MTDPSDEADVVVTGSQESSTRIVVWNANMAVHRKLGALVDKLQPDIAVVPECAAQSIVRQKGGPLLPECSMVWVRRNPNKGLAVFAFGDYTVALDESYGGVRCCATSQSARSPNGWVPGSATTFPSRSTLRWLDQPRSLAVSTRATRCPPPGDTGRSKAWATAGLFGRLLESGAEA